MVPSLPPAPPLWRLGIFTAAYIVAAAVGSALQHNREFVFYIAVMLVLIGAVALLHRRVQLTGGLLWALSAWGFLHMAGGLMPVPRHWPYDGEQNVLYSLWLIPHRLKYDQVVHAYGFGATTWVCWHALAMGVLRTHGVVLKPSLGILTLCAAAGMGFGALNEVVEFAAVLTIPNTNVGGYENTGWDLVANLIGASVAAILLRLRHRPAVLS